MAAAGQVLALVAEGGTVPFIARYRKERTGNLDEVQIRSIIQLKEDFEEVTSRRTFILGEIEKQGQLTTELKRQLEATQELATLEEIYRPFKKKKKSKAKIARDAGIEPFADWLWSVGHGTAEDKSVALEVKAKEFIQPDKGFATYDEVLQGAHHIIVDRLSSDIKLRELVKASYVEKGIIQCEKTPEFKVNSKFAMYAEYKEPIKNLFSAKNSHRYLALRRGWQEEELKVNIVSPDDDSLYDSFKKESCTQPTERVASFLYNCAKTALQIHVLPSIINEIHRQLKDQADLHAINVFSENVRKVLMASPFGDKFVIGVDPGLRTGCKVALLDKSGNYISHTVFNVVGDGDFENAKKLLSDLTAKIKVDAIGVGNGTGGREAEAFFRKVLKDLSKEEIPVVMVNEAGASVYSASDVAREEFPDLDITVRGAVSIGRRLQDPLAELVKIDPKSIGVGQYQHDVNQGKLKKSLDSVVEDCVNKVGVSLNNASSSLLQYIAGIGPGLAKNIVEYRKKNGSFKDRNELLNVPQLSAKTFEQAAGFLRIPNGTLVLDQTGVHPERYSVVREMAQELGLQVSQLVGAASSKLEPVRAKYSQLIGPFTFDDIVKELDKPARDPRDPFKVFKYREDIHELKDLKKDMVCPGIVTNVTNFGAFVDIGVHQDGLVHISQLSHQFVTDPRQVVQPGDMVQVKVIDVDPDKKQIALTMLIEPAPERRARPQQQVEENDRGRGRERSHPRNGERQNGDRSRNDQRKSDQRKNDQTRASNRDNGNRARNDRPKDDRRSAANQGAEKPRRGAAPFNNPFAALTDLNSKK